MSAKPNGPSTNGVGLFRWVGRFQSYSYTHPGLTTLSVDPSAIVIGNTTENAPVTVNGPVTLPYAVGTALFVGGNVQIPNAAVLQALNTIASPQTFFTFTALNVLRFGDFSGSWNTEVSGIAVTLKYGVSAAAGLILNTAGNVIVNAPSSGIPLTINGTTGAGGLFSSSAVTNANITADIINTSTGTSAATYFRAINAADSLEAGITSTAFSGAFFTNGPNGEQGFLGVSGNIPLSIGTSQIERIRVTGGGNVTVNAPASGIGLSIFGQNNANTIVVNAGATSGQSFGAAIQGGTTAGDYNILCQLHSGLNVFQVRGDGVVFGNDGASLFELGYKDTPINSPGGSYTLGFSDRGKTIAVASGATITIPSGVFIAGSTISFVIGSGISATLAQGSGLTLSWAGNGSLTGNRTLTGAALATVLFTSASTAFISGAGLT